MSDQTDATDLLPCPAGCNSDHLVIQGDQCRQVACTSCGWAGPPLIGKAEALAAWNRRDREARLIAALRNRDGGSHDEDCKALRYASGACNCGHEDVCTILAELETAK